MSDDVKINLGDGTTIPSVEGAPAIAVLADHKFDDGHLTLRYRLEAAGDDALHAGNVEVLVRVSRPDNSTPIPGTTESSRNAIGAQYALGMMQVAQQIIGNSLVDDFAKAVSDAVTPDSDDPVERLAETCTQIAHLLLVQNDYDAEKAKAATALITSPEWMGKAKAYGLDPDDVVKGRDLINEAIDLITAAP